MDRQEADTAIQAANVALSGRRQRQASSCASVELRDADPKRGRWEIVVTAGVGLVTVAAVLVAWLY